MKWHEVLHERSTIVYVDPYEALLGVWNGSLTINWYGATDDGEFVATDCNTLQGDDRGNATLEEAIQSAHEIVAYWKHINEEDEDA
jgi:hypothetical protein